MKKLAFLIMLALVGFTHQIKAQDIVQTIANNTNCEVSVQIVFYNAATCVVTGTCSTLTIPAHTSVVIPGCISSTPSLLGFEICWSSAVCVNCASIGNYSGAHPCAQFPAGPVTLSTECSDCVSTVAFVTIHWTIDGGSLIIG